MFVADELEGKQVAVATFDTTLGTPEVTAAATDERVAYLLTFFNSFFDGAREPTGTGQENPGRAGKSSSK